MKQPRERSVFWVATTHALTAGFVLPLLGAVVGAGAGGAVATDRDSLLPFYIYLLFVLLGYAGGGVYSLSYLKKTAILRRPSEHVVPSIIAVSALVLLNMAVSIYLFGGTALHVVLIILRDALAAAVLALVTAKGFRDWPTQPSATPAKPVSSR